MSREYAQVPSRKTLWLRAVGAVDLAVTGKAIAWAIGSFMDSSARCQSWQARSRPSQAAIARAASVSTRSVKRWLPTIEETGILVVTRPGGRVPNVYVGRIPAQLWHELWPDELVERLLNLGTLDDELDGPEVPPTAAYGDTQAVEVPPTVAYGDIAVAPKGVEVGFEVTTTKAPSSPLRGGSYVSRIPETPEDIEARRALKDHPTIIGEVTADAS